MSWLLPLAVMAAPPQTVYRCGPDGRVYSQTPCADGKALTVDDPRSAQQQKSARDVAARNAEEAARLAGERRQRDQAARGQAAGGFQTAPAAAPAAASAPARKTGRKGSEPAAPMSPAMRVPGNTQK
jgi:hypothetical protein